MIFLEKGRAPFLHEDTLRGEYPELRFPHAETPSARATLLARAGRCYDEIRDGYRSFIPFIGCGTGGSSALYGMAMERFFPADFKPRQHFPDESGTDLPLILLTPGLHAGFSRTSPATRIQEMSAAVYGCRRGHSCAAPIRSGGLR